MEPVAVSAFRYKLGLVMPAARPDPTYRPTLRVIDVTHPDREDPVLQRVVPARRKS